MGNMHMSVVTNCPCGSAHEMTPGILAIYDQVTAGADPLIKVQITGCGTWLIPRLYIACHGIKGAEVEALAAQYGWPAA